MQKEPAEWVVVRPSGYESGMPRPRPRPRPDMGCLHVQGVCVRTIGFGWSELGTNENTRDGCRCWWPGYVHAVFREQLGKKWLEKALKGNRAPHSGGAHANGVASAAAEWSSQPGLCRAWWDGPWWHNDGLARDVHATQESSKSTPAVSSYLACVGPRGNGPTPTSTSAHPLPHFGLFVLEAVAVVPTSLAVL